MKRSGWLCSAVFALSIAASLPASSDELPRLNNIAIAIIDQGADQGFLVERSDEAFVLDVLNTCYSSALKGKNRDEMLGCVARDRTMYLMANQAGPGMPQPVDALQTPEHSRRVRGEMALFGVADPALQDFLAQQVDEQIRARYAAVFGGSSWYLPLK